LWKVALQELADATSLRISGIHVRRDTL